MNLLDMPLLFLIVMLSEPHELREGKLKLQKFRQKIFWLSRITFVVAPSHHCVTFFLLFRQLLPQIPKGSTF